MWALQGGTLKKLVEFLTPATEGGNISYLFTFSTMLPSFSPAPVLWENLLTNEQVLLFQHSSDSDHRKEGAINMSPHFTGPQVVPLKCGTTKDKPQYDLARTTVGKL